MRLLLRPRELVNHLLRKRIILLSFQNQRIEVSRLARVLHLLLDIGRLLTPPETGDARLANC